MLFKYREITRILTGETDATTEDGVRWVKELCADLRVTPLGAYGVTAADIPALVSKTAIASSTKANPIQLTTNELTEILTEVI